MGAFFMSGGRGRMGRQRKGLTHKNVPICGDIFVLGCREGVGRQPNMNNTPIWVCFLCLVDEEGREGWGGHLTQKMCPFGHVFRVWWKWMAGGEG